MTQLGIICDVGGTLLHTDALHHSAWRKALLTHGIATEANLQLTRQGLSDGLDSYAIAERVGLSADVSRELAVLKQSFAQVPSKSSPNPKTAEWLKTQTDSIVAAISHSDESWTRTMLQLAGILDQMAFVRGRTGTTRVPKTTLIGDSAAILRQWWGVGEIAYCGDTELDQTAATLLGLSYIDANSL